MKSTKFELVATIVWMMLLLGFLASCGGGGKLFILKPDQHLALDESDIEDIKIAVIQCMREGGKWKPDNAGEVWDIILTPKPIEQHRTENNAGITYTVGRTNFWDKTITLSTFNFVGADENLQVESFWATALGHELVHVYLGLFENMKNNHKHKCFARFDKLTEYHQCQQIAKLKNQPSFCDWIKLEVQP